MTRFDDGSSNIDPYSPKLRITLDLICLTQPPEPDEGNDWKTPDNLLFERQDSNASFYSGQSNSSDRGKDRPPLLTEESKDER